MERKNSMNLEERIAKARRVDEVVNPQYNTTILKKQMEIIVGSEIWYFFPNGKTELLISVLVLLDFGEYNRMSVYKTDITYQEVVSKIHCLLEDENQKELGKKALLQLASGLSYSYDFLQEEKNKGEENWKENIRVFLSMHKKKRFTLEELDRCIGRYQSADKCMNQMNLCNVYGFLASQRGDEEYLRKAKVIEEKYIKRFTSEEHSEEALKRSYGGWTTLQLAYFLPYIRYWEFAERYEFDDPEEFEEFDALEEFDDSEEFDEFDDLEERYEFDGPEEFEELDEIDEFAEVNEFDERDEFHESDSVMELLYDTIIFPFLEEDVIKRDRLLERPFPRKW